MHLRREDIEAAARSSGISQTDDIAWAVLERNGRISCIAKDS
jgi:uncharacterized membrane protein YcaP (DUF421 family)